ncbi:APC family permease [candidate division KSB1 bacterium]|nr:MAG: APC family permease [candidate division KSB1 bacterium]
MTGKPTAAENSTEPVPFFTRIRRTLIGGRRNPFDPKVFQHISLIALFAWVGMGADGVSSANYGPEEAYHALRGLTFLAPLLAVMIAATVLIVSASYTLLIEQFPTGGGGYLVASKLLHPRAGVVAGSALVIGYIVTIAVSIVSGVDALFSILPPHWASARIYVAIFAVCLLVVMNLRGVKESIMALLPIFMIFIVTHFVMVSFGFLTHIPHLPERWVSGSQEAQTALSRDGLWFILLRLITAFSMGAGTLTGIEAVSNGMLSLKEPRIKTGKRTMAYMAISLSFLAALILIDYFLFDVRPTPGRTLNAVLFDSMTHGWKFQGLDVGNILLWVMLLSAALLLFVAAQTGFIGGPRVLANMAEDSWLPRRFSHLSERLVTQNGIILMGAAAVFFILYARGNISILIAIYAINVFVGFTLALLGMSKLWWTKRKGGGHWKRRFIICFTGFAVSAFMLVSMVSINFTKGVWLILFVTVALVALCFLIRRHYREVHEKVEKIDEILMTLSYGDAPVAPQPLESNEPTAIILVEKYSGTGIHVMLNVQRLFGPRFKQYIFASVGAIDSGHFKGVDELVELESEVRKQAEKYVTLARSYGLKAEARTACAIDYLNEIEQLCLRLHRDFPNSVFFAARLLFWKDTFWSRLLHNETPLSLQRRLMFHGLQFVVLPVRLQ